MANHHLHRHKGDEVLDIEQFVHPFPAFVGVGFSTGGEQFFQIAAIVHPLARIFFEVCVEILHKPPFVQIPFDIIEMPLQERFIERRLQHV